MKKIIDFGELRSDGDKFEHIVCRLLERKGLRLIRHRAIGQDKGRDLIFEENLQSRLLPKKRRWVIQCKLTASNVNWDKVDNIEKTLKCYEADSYLLIVSKDITEKLMDYLEKCSNSFDVTRWTYHELEEELLSNLDLFGEFFPTSYSNYIGLWQGTDIDICRSLEKTNHSFSKFNEWDSSRRWWTYHIGWFSGKLTIKKINRENTIILENSKEASNVQFGIALYGSRQGAAFRNLNISRPNYMSFNFMNDGDFVCNLQVMGEDRNIYYLAYYTSDLQKDPYASEDPSGMKYGNYCIGGSKSKNRYCKVERLVAKDLLRLFGVAPLIIDRICFTVSNKAKIKSLLFSSAN
jgi:Holliday junction resolvase-like predicted endonuclease